MVNGAPRIDCAQLSGPRRAWLRIIVATASASASATFPRNGFRPLSRT
jgi:hypothetical protein